MGKIFSFFQRKRNVTGLNRLEKGKGFIQTLAFSQCQGQCPGQCNC